MQSKPWTHDAFCKMAERKIFKICFFDDLFSVCGRVKIRIFCDPPYHSGYTIIDINRSQQQMFYFRNQLTACHLLLIPAPPGQEPVGRGLRGQHPLPHWRRVGRVRRPVLRRQIGAATGKEEQVHGLYGAGLQGAEDADTEATQCWEEVCG